MKLTSSRKVHYDSGPNMTPLVDVVMVILIFLMLAGSFGAASRFLPSTLPKDRGGPRGPVAISNTLDVFVTSPTPETFRARLGGGETFTDAASLRDALVAKRLLHESQGSPASQMQVLVHPRVSTRHRHVMEAYEAVLDAQWPKVGFGTARD
jgi:biopolymer transport protein ExbD